MARVKVTNDTGVVLIDDTHVNLCLLYKGNGVINGNPDGYAGVVFQQITYAAARSSPMLVIISEVFSCQLSFDGSSWWIAWPQSAVGQSFQYMIFDVPQVALPGTGLMVLRNAQGQVTFDSDGQYMRCQGMMNVPQSGVILQNFEINRKYGVAHVKGDWSRQFIPIPMGGITQILHHYSGLRVSGSTVYAGKFAEFNRALTGEFARSSAGSSPGIALVIDVTGY